MDRKDYYEKEFHIRPGLKGTMKNAQERIVDSSVALFVHGVSTVAAQSGAQGF